MPKWAKRFEKVSKREKTKKKSYLSCRDCGSVSDHFVAFKLRPRNSNLVPSNCTLLEWSLKLYWLHTMTEKMEGREMIKTCVQKYKTKLSNDSAIACITDPLYTSLEEVFKERWNDQTAVQTCSNFFHRSYGFSSRVKKCLRRGWFKKT